MKLEFKLWLESNIIRNTVIDLLGFDSDKPDAAIPAKLRDLDLGKLKHRGFISTLPFDKRKKVEALIEQPGNSDVGDLLDLIQVDPLASSSWIPRRTPPPNEVPPPSAPFQQGGGIGVG